MLSLMVSAGAWAAEARVEALAKQLQSLDPKGKAQVLKSLSNADRKALHAEFRALPAEKQRALKAMFGRNNTAKMGKAPKVVGTVQYDTDTPHSFRDNTNAVAGNQFNTGFGNPHTISVITFQQVGAFFTTPVRVYGAPAGTVAPVLAGATFSALPVGVEVQWDLANIAGHNGVFLAGESQSGSSSTISTTFVAVAVDINNGGQGFHGMNINLGGSGFNPNATVAPGVPYNALFRATGENLPVELMNFDIQ
jgi:hypothetical protein